MPLTKKEVFINNNFIINIKDLCKFPRDFLDYILSCTSYFILNHFTYFLKTEHPIFLLHEIRRDFKNYIA